MTLTLARMDPERIAEWLSVTRVQYIAERIEAGETRAEAEANVELSYGRTFPDGVPSPTQRIFDVLDGDTVVGYLWLAPRSDTEPDHWWIWDIEIADEHRGRGLGRATMILAEDAARSEGATSLGLNVFGGNAVARRLYTSLDYREMTVQMRKEL